MASTSVRVVTLKSILCPRPVGTAVVCVSSVRRLSDDPQAVTWHAKSWYAKITTRQGTGASTWHAKFAQKGGDVNNSDTEYMYERIAKALRDQILTRELAPGGKLPTQDELCEAFGVSRQVARQALDLLGTEGLIDRQQGGRATVRLYDPLVRRASLHYKSLPGAPFAEEALATDRTPRYTYETTEARADLETATRLKIAVGDPVIQTDYMSYANDEPLMIVTSFEPLAITRGTVIERPEEGTFMGDGIIDRFTAIALRPTRVVERLHSRMPRPSEVKQLQLKPGTPVLVIVRTVYSDDTPVETGTLLLASNQYKLEYTIPVAPLTPGIPSSGEQ
ncbi:GntR family transcriptional regulator [Actinocrispum wychmicini]|uniref:GntR family transcriptional regulator n=1 Tax=Actinocrispum wychmicini TaxID=1213861 RepID=A0A4V2S7D4_9PSEU|nr:GntR family transcriptional regulator [Actinocrispum wychmicini]TCO59450.1 GntR family transcriptional regulator [Actinocrispum wychmicini]